MKIFEIFRKKEISKDHLTLEKLVEIRILTKEEMLLIKKERAVKEWENEGKSGSERSHHKHS